jgi:hypothetical protein
MAKHLQGPLTSLKEVKPKLTEKENAHKALPPVPSNNDRPTEDFLTEKCYGIKWRHRIGLHFFTSRDFRAREPPLSPHLIR